MKLIRQHAHAVKIIKSSSVLASRRRKGVEATGFCIYRQRIWCKAFGLFSALSPLCAHGLGVAKCGEDREQRGALWLFLTPRIRALPEQLWGVLLIDGQVSN